MTVFQLPADYAECERFARTCPVSRGDVAVFDIDDTAIVSDRPNGQIFNIYNIMRSRGIRPLFVTARSESWRLPTVSMLRQCGYSVVGDGYDEVFMMPDWQRHAYGREELVFSRIPKFKAECRDTIRRRNENIIFMADDVLFNLEDDKVPYKCWVTWGH